MSKKEEVINYIKEKIVSGKWDVGSKIFSENQLSQYLSVSVNTVRSAISELAKDNILETRKGSGSFVKTNLNEEKKEFIILSTDEDAINGEIHYIYNNFIDEMKKSIIKQGYKPIVYIGSDYLNINSALSQVLNKTAGIISLKTLPKDLKELDKMNIPIVDTFSGRITPYPSVLIDTIDFFHKILNIINTYNLNDILVFSLKNYVTRKSVVFDFYAMERYFEKYNISVLPISHFCDLEEEHFKTKLKSLTKIPDAVIFLDDNLFLKCEPLFSKFDNIFSQTKIITQTNNSFNYKGPYDICRIDYDLDNMAQETVRLLINLIDKSPIYKYNILIQPCVINKEIFKKVIE